jgi:ribosomal protein S1
MAGYKKPMKSLQKGDTVEGIVTKLTPSEILVDINAKTEAVVLEKEKRLLKTLLSSLKVGDKVTVSVLNPESDFGYPVVSLRRFMGDTSWKHLEEMQKKQESLSVSVTEATRGGYVVATAEGVSGFLPNSHTSFTASENDAEMVGKKLKVYILELSRSANKVIFSQKEVLKAEDFTKAIATLKKGDKITVVVTNTASFGVFVAVPAGDKKLDGLIHISEISWEKTTDVSGMFEIGQEIEAAVIGFDKEGKRVDLSIKRLTEDPFEKIASKYAVDQQVAGTVKALGAQGVEVELEDGTAGFIRKEKIPPTITYKEGDSVKATVASVDKKKQRIMLVPVLAVKPLGYR